MGCRLEGQKAVLCKIMCLHCTSRKCPDSHLRLVLVRNQRIVILPLLPQVIIFGSLLGQKKIWCSVKDSP